MTTIEQLVNEQLKSLVPYEPGKPIDDVAREIGLEPGAIIKLASNENPLGPSPKAMEAIKAALPQSHLYPDGGGFHLRNAMAEHFGVKKENIVLGCGSNEIISLLYMAFTKAGKHNIIISRYAFSIYALTAQLLGIEVKIVPDKNLHHDLEAMLKAIEPHTRLVFIASPNNPTGTRVDNAELETFLEKVPDHVIVVLDEAYYEFLENPPDTLRHVKEGKKKLILMRTFSKAQGLAGLRMGYGLAAPELIEFLQRSRQPFNTTSLSQVAALAGLKDAEHQRRTMEVTNAGRAKMEKAFKEMGLTYVPSCANFVLVKVGDGKKVFEAFMRKGIIVRSMVGYLLPEYIRVSVGTPEQVERFLKELPIVLQELSGK